MEYDVIGGSDRNHTVKSGSTLQSLTALSVGEAEFYAVVKGGQVGVALRSTYQDLGILMKIEIQSDSSTSNSLTGSIGSRTTNETATLGYKNEFQMENLGIEKVLTGKTAQMLEGSSLCTTVQITEPAGQKQIIVEHRDGCAKLGETTEWWTSLALLTMIMKGGERRGEAKQWQDTARNFANTGCRQLWREL